MENLFDLIFSSTILIALLIVAIQSIAYLIFKLWQTIDYEKLRNIIVLVIAILPAPIVLGMYIYGNYGYAEKITDIRIYNNKIYLIDHKQRKMKNSNAYMISRIYTINLEDGQKINRTKIKNNSKIIDFYKNDIAIHSPEGDYLYNLQTFETQEAEFKSISKNSDTTIVNNIKLAKHKNIIICTENNFNIIWKIDLQKLDINTDTDLITYYFYQDKVIIVFGTNYLFCVNLYSGKIFWQKRI